VGVIKELLLLPLAPVRGTVWVVEQVAEEADRQLYDPAAIRRQLAELEMDYESGRLSDEERDQEEAVLLERLTIARERELERSEWGDR